MKKQDKKQQKPKFPKKDFKEMSKAEFLEALFQVVYYVKYRL